VKGKTPGTQELRVPRDIYLLKSMELAIAIQALLTEYTEKTGAVVRRVQVFYEHDSYAIIIDDD
jgi:hypothetical protein